MPPQVKGHSPSTTLPKPKKRLIKPNKRSVKTGAWRGNIDAPPQTPVPHPPVDHEHDPAVTDGQPIYPGMPGPVNPWMRP